MTVDTSTLLQLQALRRSYGEELPNRIALLEKLWGNRHEAGMLAALHLKTHSLAGSGATFGYAEVSRVARQLEILLKAILLDHQMLDADCALQVEQLLAALREAATRPGTRDSVLTPEQTIIRASRERDIVLLLADREAGDELCTQMNGLGYSCRFATTVTLLPAALRAATPLAAVLDADLYPTTEPLRDTAGNRVPVVFLSSRDDLAERLRCVRAGGRAYFNKPVDVLALADVLDELTLRNPREPYRVLIVEDTQDLAAYYAFILDSAGMTTQIVTDPLSVMDALHSFHPDLVLMDLYMPDCNGLELAAVIRQQQVFVGIPIVFLSGETDSDKQLVAMSSGADDFLNKSISPAHLVRSLAARVARSRNMRSLMMRDGLTGLYNHTSIKEQLDRELARAARHQTALAYAMLDIDKFKSVNDNYGHPAGDRVLRSLSRYLKQRLRGSDIIGRYGGEEFVVVLPDTTPESAMTVMNDIREGFGQLIHHTEQGDITVTFSCGIAGYPACREAQQLSDAADRALYQAKQAGRNQVRLA